MKVFKFGGASVKDPSSVRNVAHILKRFAGEQIVVIVSAMGKTTNALEEVTNAVFYKKGGASNRIDQIQDFHTGIIQDLFPDPEHPVHAEINQLFIELEKTVFSKHIVYYDQVYDQIVSYGELISTKILYHYLLQEEFKTVWRDARELVRTDARYRDALIDWKETSFRVRKELENDFAKANLVISQGFIGGNNDRLTTTLGREGSDFSGAIFAFALDAESLTIWKDVPGLLNADPKYFEDTELIEKISFKETIELAFYGASIIHPKTIKPLQNKNIPLHVKSFLDPESEGSVVQEDPVEDSRTSSIIVKRDQVLISISARDFSFVDEKNISIIYDRFARHGIKVNLMQNSAISLSVCVDQADEKIATFIVELKDQFRIRFNEDLELITIRHYTDEKIRQLIQDKEVLLEQKSRITAQYVVKS